MHKDLEIKVFVLYSCSGNASLFCPLSHKKSADIERSTRNLVQKKRFELSRDCSHCRLKTACLPFHHSCMIECPTIIH